MKTLVLVLATVIAYCKATMVQTIDGGTMWSGQVLSGGTILVNGGTATASAINGGTIVVQDPRVIQQPPMLVGDATLATAGAINGGTILVGGNGFIQPPIIQQPPMLVSGATLATTGAINGGPLLVGGNGFIQPPIIQQPPMIVGGPTLATTGAVNGGTLFVGGIQQPQVVVGGATLTTVPAVTGLQIATGPMNIIAGNTLTSGAANLMNQGTAMQLGSAYTTDAALLSRLNALRATATTTAMQPSYSIIAETRRTVGNQRMMVGNAIDLPEQVTYRVLNGPPQVPGTIRAY